MRAIAEIVDDEIYIEIILNKNEIAHLPKKNIVQEFRDQVFLKDKININVRAEQIGEYQ